jgi:hypothetical protein
MTYKFLARGAIGPFSGFAWPTGGDWVEVNGPLDVGRCGIHVCRAGDLAHWLHEELWEVEIDGEQMVALDCLVARRARLVRHVDGWASGGARRFAEAAIEHAAAQADTDDLHVRELIDDAREAAGAGYIAVSAFTAALAVARIGAAADRERGFRRERAWQAGWIGRELIGR